jgi:hypothetical protein
MNKLKKHAYQSAIVIVAVLAIGFGVNAFSGNIMNVENFYEANTPAQEEMVGALVGPNIYSDVRVLGTLNSKYKTTVIAPGSSTVGHGTTTLTVDESGTNYLLSATGTTIILPDVAYTGANYRFTINGAAGVNNFIINPAGTDEIQGTLIVAGAVVDCRDETALNFVVDGEQIGDYVEVMSDGTQWLIVDSGVLTGSKLTCTGG